MNKKQITKDDGRYLIYYTFESKPDCPRCKGKARQEKEEKPSV